LSKQLDKAHVCPCLLDFSAADLTGPLAAFQAVTADREGVFKITEIANKALGDDRLTDGQLQTAFEKWYGDMDRALAAVRTSEERGPRAPSRPDRELLEEMLGILRSSNRTGQERGPELSREPWKWASAFIPAYDAGRQLDIYAAKNWDERSAGEKKSVESDLEALSSRLEDFRDYFYDSICPDAKKRLSDLIYVVNKAKDEAGGDFEDDTIKETCTQILDAILFNVPF
jgi:hypothetical protein